MDHFEFPFACLSNENISHLNNVQHHFPLHVIESMIFNSVNYQEEKYFPNNCPIQTSDYKPYCNYYFVMNLFLPLDNVTFL